MNAIHAYGSEKQKAALLPKLAAGELIGCFGFTEPDHSSNPGSIETRAVYNENSKSYTISGSKTWIVNGPVADILVVWLKSTRHNNKVKGFILERSKIQSGLSTPKFDGFSLRTSVTGMILLDDVKVDESALLPNAEGLHAPISCLEHLRYDTCWGTLGAAEFCFDTVRNFVTNRLQFGDLHAASQFVQKRMADMVSEISLGLASCLQVGLSKLMRYM